MTRKIISIIAVLVFGGIVHLLITRTPPETVVIYKQTPLSPKRVLHNTPSNSQLSVSEENTPIPEEISSQETQDEIDIAPVDLTQPLDASDATLGETETPQAEMTADVPVSPFGFGPYPEVPQGFPEHLMPIWTWSDERRQRVAGREIDFELMHRVLIELYNDGDHVFRAVIRSDKNGKVYPLYDDVVYVKHWQEIRLPDGTVAQYPAGQLTTKGFISPQDFVESGGKLPAHIEFIDRDTAGYNPYHFLNLER